MRWLVGAVQRESFFAIAPLYLLFVVGVRERARLFWLDCRIPPVSLRLLCEIVIVRVVGTGTRQFLPYFIEMFFCKKHKVTQSVIFFLFPFPIFCAFPLSTAAHFSPTSSSHSPSVPKRFTSHTISHRALLLEFRSRFIKSKNASDKTRVFL